MNTINYLKKFFLENASAEAAVPGLGIFYVEQHQEGHPTIMFAEKLPKSKAFLNFLAFEENLTEQEALDVLEKWVQQILKELKGAGVSSIAGLGTFEISEGKVEFFPTVDPFEGRLHNQDSDSEEDSENYEEEQEEPILKFEKNRDGASYRRSMMISLIVLAVLLIGGGIYLFREQISGCFTTSERTDIIVLPGSEPAQEEAQEPTQEETRTEDEYIAQAVAEGEMQKQAQVKQEPKSEPKPKVQPKVEVKPQTPTKPQVKVEAKPQVKSSTTPKQIAAGYYVIAGAFGQKENAQKNQAEFVAKSYNPEIIYNDEKSLYMVSLKRFVDMDQALDYKAKIRDEKGIPCWIYKK